MNIAVEELKKAEEKEEIVRRKFLKGGDNDLFCVEYSSVAKASEGFVAESDQATGNGFGIAQLWYGDPGWVRDDQALERISQNRAGEGFAAAATLA